MRARLNLFVLAAVSAVTLTACSSGSSVHSDIPSDRTPEPAATAEVTPSATPAEGLPSDDPGRASMDETFGLLWSTPGAEQLAAQYCAMSDAELRVAGEDAVELYEDVTPEKFVLYVEEKCDR